MRIKRVKTMTVFRNVVDVILTPDDLCQHVMYDVNCTAQCTLPIGNKFIVK